MGKCGFCEEFKRQRDHEHKELRYEYSAVLERSVYGDGHFLFRGKCSSYPLRFCPECGKRLDGQEKPCGDCPAVFAVKAMAVSDLQPVVRCKDCVHSRERNEHERNYLVEDVLICTHPDCSDDCWFATWYDHWCRYGERRRTE